MRVTAAGRPPTMACLRWRSWRSTPPPRTSSTGRTKNPLHSISATSQIFWLKKAGFDGVWWPESRDFVKIQGAFSPEFSTTGPTIEWLQVYHVHMWCIKFIWPILVSESWKPRWTYIFVCKLSHLHWFLIWLLTLFANLVTWCCHLHLLARLATRWRHLPHQFVSSSVGVFISQSHQLIVNSISKGSNQIRKTVFF